MQKQLQQQQNKGKQQKILIKSLMTKIEKMKKKGSSTGKTTPFPNAALQVIPRSIRNPVDIFCRIWSEAFKDPFARSSSGLCPGYLASEGFEPYLFKATFQLQNNTTAGFVHLFSNPTIMACVFGTSIPTGSNFGCENITVTNGNFLTNFGATVSTGTTGLSSSGNSFVVLNAGYRIRSVQSVNSTSAIYRGARISVRTDHGMSSDYLKAPGLSMSTPQYSTFLIGYDPSVIDTESLPGTLPRFTNYDIMERAKQFSFRPVSANAFRIRQTNDGANGTIITTEGTSSSYSVVDIINTGLVGNYSTQQNGPTSSDGWDTIVHQIFGPTGTALAEIEMIFHLAIQPTAPSVLVGSGNVHMPVPSAQIPDDSNSVNPGLLHQWASRAIDIAGKTVDFVSRNRAAQNTISRLMIANGYV